MNQVERIISRGTPGPELAALAVAKLYGLETGGSTRLAGHRSASIIRNHGLSKDRCSRRQALLRNIRQADGTLVLGRFGRDLEALLRAENTHFCCIEMLHQRNAVRVGQWLDRHAIRTLNVVAAGTQATAFMARAILLSVLQPIDGRLPRPQVPDSIAWTFVAGRKACFAVRIWPKLEGWRRSDHAGVWKVADRHTLLQLVKEPVIENRWVSELLWQQVPSEILFWIQDAKGWGYRDIGMTEVFGRFGRVALDLVRARRWAMLGLILEASGFRSGAAPDEAKHAAIATWLAGRQRDFLGNIGFPATESAVRTLAKVSRRASNSRDLARLRDLIRDPATFVLLQRLPQLNGTVIHVLSHPNLRRAITPRLLRQFASVCGPISGRDFDIWWLERDVESLSIWADHAGCWDRIGPIQSFGSLKRWVTAVVGLSPSKYREPPKALPGVSRVILPLINPHALQAEGRAMHNCVGDYSWQVQVGACLIYRILPDAARGTTRATLELRPTSDGQWQIKQLRGAFNTMVNKETSEFVNNWLDSANKSVVGLSNVPV